MLIACLSFKGSPGVTTGSLALARYWREDRNAMLIESDPVGGDLAAKLGGSPSVGMWSLLADLRYPDQSPSPTDPKFNLSSYAQTLANGVNVLFGLQGRSGESLSDDRVFGRLCELLSVASNRADLIVDLGRLSPVPCPPQLGILGRCDAALVFFDTSIEGVVALNRGIGILKGLSNSPTIFGVPAFRTGFDAAEVSDALGIPVIARLPSDPKGVRSLYRSSNQSISQAKRLSKWSMLVCSELIEGAEALAGMRQAGPPRGKTARAAKGNEAASGLEEVTV